MRPSVTVLSLYTLQVVKYMLREVSTFYQLYFVLSLSYKTLLIMIFVFFSLPFCCRSSLFFIVVDISSYCHHVHVSVTQQITLYLVLQRTFESQNNIFIITKVYWMQNNQTISSGILIQLFGKCKHGFAFHSF